jgi:hypothetical protein
MRVNQAPALAGRDAAAQIVDAHLPLIRKLVWEFIKRQEEGRFSFRELMPVAYEAARKAMGTFDPGLGFVFATHVRKRLQYALNDYAGDRDRTVPKMELRQKRYSDAWGDPDAKRAEPPKVARPLLFNEFDDGNGNRVRRYTEGPYRSNPQLIRGLGKVTRRHGKVPIIPIRSEFNDGWQASDGCGWPHARVEDDCSPGVTDPRHFVWAGDKEFKGKAPSAPAEYREWERVWANNYRKYCVRATTPDMKALLEWTDSMVGREPAYERDDGARMFENPLLLGCYLAENYQTKEDREAAEWRPVGNAKDSSRNLGLSFLPYCLRGLQTKPPRPTECFVQVRDETGHLRTRVKTFQPDERQQERRRQHHARAKAGLWGWIPDNVHMRTLNLGFEASKLKGPPLPTPKLPQPLFLPLARRAYDQGRTERRRIVELVMLSGENAKKLRAKERRIVAEVDAPWGLPNPVLLSKLREERPTWWADEEIKNHTDRWVMVSIQEY